jgi:S1-C subfamily serine protease
MQRVKDILRTVFLCLVMAGIGFACVAVPVLMILDVPTTTTAHFGIADQVERVRDTVVHIYKEGVGQGSGCIISEDGFIFTAKHVTDGDAGNYVVTLDDGTKYDVVEVLEVKDHDVAILRIEPDEPLPYSRLAEAKDMRPGDMLFIMGSPYGDTNFNSVTLGILSAVNRDYPDYQWSPVFQTDAPGAWKGNSGGPCFNMNGEVIGVLVGGMQPGLNYNVPVDIFMYDLDTIRLWFELSKFELVKEADYEVNIYLTDEEIEFYKWREQYAEGS